jgi:glutamate/aspartate transport system substrate-binding protein
MWRGILGWVFGAAAAVLLVPSAGAEELYGTLKKIKETGTITLGRSEQSIPFSYLDDKGQPIGYSIDLCMRIVDAVKQELKLDKLDVKFVTVMGTTTLPLLINGTVDMVCTTTTMTLARMNQVDFLSITYITGNQLLVKKGSGIHEVEDLKGKVVAVNQGTQNERIIHALDDQLKLGIRFIPTEDQPHGWLALETDRADCYVTDAIVEHGLIHAAAHPEQYEVVGRLLSYDPYSFVVRHDDSAFRTLGVRTLAEIFRSGEINKIYDKWLGPIAGPPSEMLKTVWAAQAFPP